MNTRTAHGIRDIFSVTSILHACGKNMVRKNDLHHWDNSWIKCLLIVFLCLTKNKVYVVEQEKIVGTYQIKIKDQSLYFEKLAVNPESEHKGVGSFCLMQIEKEARNCGCNKVQMDVYVKSRHAIQFYKNHGYTQVGEDKTLKYNVVCMEKSLQ